MKERDDLLELLLAVLRPIDFDQRYYGFYNRIRENIGRPAFSKAEIEKALADINLTFKYNAKERFFSAGKSLGPCTLSLKVAVRYEAELILGLQTPRGSTGGPFPFLANMVGTKRDPNFSPKPPYPTLPFSNLEEFREIIQFGLELFNEIADALVKSGLCISEN